MIGLWFKPTGWVLLILFIQSKNGIRNGLKKFIKKKKKKKGNGFLFIFFVENIIGFHMDTIYMLLGHVKIFGFQYFILIK